MTTPNAIAIAWGEEIASRRQALEMSRAQLAQSLGVSRRMVGLWETGVHAPSSPMQARLIAELDIDLSEVADRMKRAAIA